MSAVVTADRFPAPTRIFGIPSSQTLFCGRNSLPSFYGNVVPVLFGHFLTVNHASFKAPVVKLLGPSRLQAPGKISFVRVRALATPNDWNHKYDMRRIARIAINLVI